MFQQPPNTKSQTLLGCLKQGIPLHDFVLGGGGGSGASAAALKRGGDVEDERERGVRRQSLVLWSEGERGGVRGEGG